MKNLNHMYHMIPTNQIGHHVSEGITIRIRKLILLLRMKFFG